ncbi:MAG: hypothetical protein M0Q37_07120 [Sphaerochaeta sp.]|nr:hypothetical protein [Sphaerochaeta sp.]
MIARSSSPVTSQESCTHRFCCFIRTCSAPELCLRSARNRWTWDENGVCTNGRIASPMRSSVALRPIISVKARFA